MTELLTAAQMRAIEKAAIDSGEVTGLELMERAGQGVVEAIFEEWPELAKTSHRAAVLCGPGNNGGDGFVVARLLKEWGWEVDVFLYGDPKTLPPDAMRNYERWIELGPVGEFLSEGAVDSIKFGFGENGIVVDALFGTGLTRPLSPEVRMRLGDFQTQVPVWFLHQVAIDIPSGICSDSGRPLVGSDGFEPSPFTELCVTFHRPRLGHILGDFGGTAKRYVVKDIGIPEPSQRALTSELVEALAEFASLDDPKKALKAAMLDVEHDVQVSKVELLAGFDAEVSKNEFPGSHKYDYGHALILSGGSGQTGAARLAARGALRIGTGLVTVGAPGSAMMECATQLTAIMLKRCDDGKNLTELLQDGRLAALCLGPALGTGARARDLIRAALKDQRPTVLDADALTVLSEDGELFGKLHENCVLTPHTGEFRRLFPDIAAKLDEAPTTGPAYSKVDATREAAKWAGCVVLFKGPDTVIAASDGRCAINSAAYERSAPWLATAGSGDVLAGFITGLLARGFDPLQAAETAAWLHVECARAFGPGLIAEDLPDMLPQVFRDLGV